MKKFISAVVVTLLGATLAFAAPHEGAKAWGHGKRGAFNGRLAQELDLTDTQKAQIKDIRRSSREANKAFFQQARATRRELFAAKEANDTAKIDALKATLDAQRAQMQQIRAADHSKIASVLTPEQNAKWQELKARHGERHHRQR